LGGGDALHVATFESWIGNASERVGLLFGNTGTPLH